MKVISCLAVVAGIVEICFAIIDLIFLHRYHIGESVFLIANGALVIAVGMKNLTPVADLPNS